MGKSRSQRQSCTVWVKAMRAMSVGGLRLRSDAGVYRFRNNLLRSVSSAIVELIAPVPIRAAAATFSP